MELSKKIFVPNANTKQLLQKVTDRVSLFLSSIALFSHIFHAGPTCKKMNDLSQTKVFKSMAFEPEEDEVEEADRARKRQLAPKKSAHPSTVSRAESSDLDSEVEVSAPSRFRGATPELESSDDDMPDFSQLFANKGKLKKKGKDVTRTKTLGRQSDDVRITCSLALAVTNWYILQVVNDLDDMSDHLNDSDVELGRAVQSSKYTKSEDDRKRDATTCAMDEKSIPGDSKGKEKVKLGEPDDPSGALIAIWRRGDCDLEPSAKMLALIDYLQSWDASGDKTICYSQCPYLH